MIKNVSILGSTGSIGTQALEVISSLGYSVCGLSAYQNTQLLAEQIQKFLPKIVCIYDENKLLELKSRLDNIIVEGIEFVTGIEGLCKVASCPQADIVLNSVVGMIGLRPTLAAIAAKKDVALANKEALVTGGKLVMEQALAMGVSILPVDSEHSAIFQSMQGNHPDQVKRIILTASGGPFFGKTINELKNVTVEEALNHPNWTMGAKITVDSATMMNKGLELIEACWLFGKTPDEVEIVVHRESVIHSLVEFKDNAVIAQLGVPDMKLPIQYALTYPNRVACETPQLSLAKYGKLTFFDVDFDTFLCLKACIKAANFGGLHPTVVNGANEEAVELFLSGKIGFTQIGEVVLAALDNVKICNDYTVEGIVNTDIAARKYVQDYFEKGTRLCQ